MSEVSRLKIGTKLNLTIIMIIIVFNIILVTLAIKIFYDEEEERLDVEIKKINQLDNSGKSALFYVSNSQEIVRKLIEKKINLNILDEDKNNLLMQICKSDNNLEISKLLIESGISLKQINNTGENALIIAGKNKAIKTLDYN